MTAILSAAQQQRQSCRNQLGEYSEYERNEAAFTPPTAADSDTVLWDSAAVPDQRPGPDGVINQADLVTHRRVAYLTDKKLRAAGKRVAAINAKLAAAGSGEEFTLTADRIVVRDSDGLLYETNQVVVDTPHIQAGEWAFAAVITPIGGDSGDAITQPLPDMEAVLGGWRATDAARCDHCGRTRRREKTYAIVNADGDLMQVGSSCVQPFTGIDAANMLRWLEFGADDLTDDDDRYGASDPESRVIDVRESIARALAFSDGGKRFVTKKEAQYNPTGMTATATLVDGFNLLPGAEQAAVRRAAAGFLADGTVDHVIAAAQAMDGDGDYAINMRALTGHRHVGSRHLGVVTSAVKVWMRQQEKDAERAAKAAMPLPAKGWIAPVGESLKGRNIPATVTKAVGSTFYINGYEKATTMLILETDDGHVLKWAASSARPENVGDKVIITGGSVKAHDTYKDVDQTVLVRVKLEKAGLQDM